MRTGTLGGRDSFCLCFEPVSIAQRIALEGHHLEVRKWTFRTDGSKVSRGSQVGQKDGEAEGWWSRNSWMCLIMIESIQLPVWLEPTHPRRPGAATSMKAVGAGASVPCLLHCAAKEWWVWIIGGLAVSLQLACGLD